jgi:hypothetical protein
VSGVWGEGVVVDNVKLRRSIISCSFVVLTGAGGSGRANALLGIGVTVAFTEVTLSPVPVDVS